MYKASKSGQEVINDKKKKKGKLNKIHVYYRKLIKLGFHIQRAAEMWVHSLFVQFACHLIFDVQNWRDDPLTLTAADHFSQKTALNWNNSSDQKNF